jgi:hypothetical protein
MDRVGYPTIHGGTEFGIVLRPHPNPAPAGKPKGRGDNVFPPPTLGNRGGAPFSKPSLADTRRSRVLYHAPANLFCLKCMDQA